MCWAHNVRREKNAGARVRGSCIFLFFGGGAWNIALGTEREQLYWEVDLLAVEQGVSE